MAAMRHLAHHVQAERHRRQVVHHRRIVHMGDLDVAVTWVIYVAKENGVMFGGLRCSASCVHLILIHMVAYLAQLAPVE
jgi:hypothetical protein